MLIMNSTPARNFYIITAMSASYFRKQIFLPQDHGSWVFIFSPLLVGLFAGRQFNLASLCLVIAAVVAFLIRQPITMAVKAYAGRRPRTELSASAFWIAVYGFILLLALIGLIRAGFIYILLLAVPVAPVFAWHLWLVSRREERRQVNVEILATGVLALAAPAAYWVGISHYDASGWWLWFLTWFQSAASIVYTYLRLAQREWKEVPPRAELWKTGWRAFACTTFNLVASMVFGLFSVLPHLIFIPYLVQWSETLWGIFHPAVRWKPVQIGMRQLVVSVLWTILFIVFWRS